MDRVGEKVRIREVDLARKVIEWLIDQKWEVYQEVQVFSGGAIADIVARQGKLIWIVETKMTLSLSVLGQAHEWLHLANWVSVAVPAMKRFGFAQTVLKTYGVGLLKVGQYDCDWRSSVEEIIRPVLRRNIGTHVLDSLTEQHKTYAEAGNSEGRRWSPFKETCLQIYRYVQVNEGCFLKDVLNNVKHHYASTATARSCIPKWAEAGEIERIRVEKEKGQWRFYTNEEGQK